MSRKFYVIVEDDFELEGNGVKNVADVQYLPALALMNIAQKLDIKLTFMAETAQQLAFIRCQNSDPNLKLQRVIWDETVSLIKHRGFDVQLHLHPQWMNAEYKNEYWYLNDNWNIGAYSQHDQSRLLTESISYLKNLLQGVDPDYKVIAFKAGSWGLQPSETLLKEFIAHGIKIVTGVRYDMVIKGISLDYSDLSERYLPYHPDLKDIQKLSAVKNDLIVIPLQYYKPNIFTFSSFILRYLLHRLLHRNNNWNYYYGGPVPEAVKSLNPLWGRNLLRFSLYPYATHLKIGEQDFSYLKSSFDSVVKQLRKFDIKGIPILIESHTKRFDGYYEDIKRFLSYIVEKYGDECEFTDMTSFYKKVETENIPVKTSKTT